MVPGRAGAGGMASMRGRAAIETVSARSRSWSEGVLWKPADVDEVSEAATRTDARLSTCRSLGRVGDALSRGLEIGGCSGLRREFRRSDAVELQQEASLSGEVAFGRVPEAKVADLVQAGREDMLEEAAHELVALQGAVLPARRFAVLVANGDGAIIEAEDAGVGDGGAEDVAGEITQHRLGALAPVGDVNHPGPGPSGLGNDQVGSLVGKGGLELAAHQLGQRLVGDEESSARRVPCAAVGGHAAAGDEAMNVRMVEPSLKIPGIIISLIFSEQRKLVFRAPPLQN